jgi:hypothetical protein
VARRNAALSEINDLRPSPLVAPMLRCFEGGLLQAGQRSLSPQHLNRIGGRHKLRAIE